LSDVAAPNIASTSQRVIDIVFGSQSGNAEALAKRTSKTLKAKGFAPKVIDAEQISISALPETKLLLLITSTFGEGDPPDNIAAFHRELHETMLDLSGLRYCVLALGDKNYKHFCKTGKDFDARLAKLGATRLQPIVECDVDYESTFARWLDQTIAALGSDEPQTPNLKSIGATATIAPNNGHSNGTGNHVANGHRAEPSYSRRNPFFAAISARKNLHGANSAKRVVHVEFNLAQSMLTYEVGDALGVFASNRAELVEEMLALLGFDGDADVPTPSGEMSLREAMLNEFDITKLHKTMVEAMALKSNDAELTELLKPEQADALRAFCYGREIVDLLIAQRGSFESPEEFVAMLRPLQPRLYSISSSQKAHPNTVHLTVGVVEYESCQRQRFGVCSFDLALEKIGSKRRVFVQANKHFKLPGDSNANIIMIGPGTGIAPFRAFLQERAITNARGKNWLFFGCRNSEDDFLYEQELIDFRANGVLHRFDVAFSRQQAQKCYVQHKLEENGADIWRWLNEGAFFYVCGDATRMAKDVYAALCRIVTQHGGFTSEQAEHFVEQLQQDKRYLRDVY
jgi:sulfite reductase (NADPH) flavoprotein alpha-component